MNNKYFYPCIVTKEEGVYYANFCDFDNCFTDGKSIEEINSNAKDVLNAVVYSMLKNNKELPIPNSKNIELEKNQFMLYIELWLSPLMDRIQKQSVKKTLTIPKWLNDEAEKYNVNYSNLLQTALKDYLGIKI